MRGRRLTHLCRLGWEELERMEGRRDFPLVTGESILSIFIDEFDDLRIVFRRHVHGQRLSSKLVGLVWLLCFV